MTVGYVINLDSDVARLRKVEEEFSESAISIIRVPGIRASTLPKFITNGIKGYDSFENNYGTAGCFLSHIRCWEIVSENKSAFIFEDDIRLIGRESFDNLEAPLSPYDLVFVNDRMSGRHPAKQVNVSTISLYEEISARADARQIACGGDGYYLSRSGADALLSFVSQHGIWGDIDWFLLYCAIGSRNLHLISHNQIFHRKLSAFDHIYGLKDPILRGACLDRPLVEHKSMKSSRLTENSGK